MSFLFYIIFNNSSVKVNNVEIESDNNLLDDVDSKIIYEDRSSFSFIEKFLSRIGFNKFSDLLLFTSILFLILVSFAWGFSFIIEDNAVFLIISGLVLALFLSGYEMVSPVVSTLHPNYYLIGEDKIIEIPKNETEPEKIIYKYNIEDFTFDGNVVKFSDDDNVISFSLSDSKDISIIQDYIYNID